MKERECYTCDTCNKAYLTAWFATECCTCKGGCGATVSAKYYDGWCDECRVVKDAENEAAQIAKLEPITAAECAAGPVWCRNNDTIYDYYDVDLILDEVDRDGLIAAINSPTGLVVQPVTISRPEPIDLLDHFDEYWSLPGDSDEGLFEDLDETDLSIILTAAKILNDYRPRHQDVAPQRIV